ncbi:hypothetical protein Q1695_003007 [Nippostrongylus brasiliensis]|nr:hypothetical protein Q1695_003007 [Nippostrongylus brasiliensis]
MNRRDFLVLMLYEFKLGHFTAEAARNIGTAFEMESPTERTVRLWFGKFTSGDFNIGDKTKPGRRTSLDDGILRAAVASKSDTTVRQLATGMDVHSATVARHLDSIGMVKKRQKWTPHELTDEQRLTRFNSCSTFSSVWKTIRSRTG